MSDETDICDDPGCAVCVDDGPGTSPDDEDVPGPARPWRDYRP